MFFLGVFPAGVFAQLTAVTGLTVTPGYQSLKLTWNSVGTTAFTICEFTSASKSDIPDNHGRAGQGAADPTKGWFLVSGIVGSSDATSCTINGHQTDGRTLIPLTNGTTYRVRVTVFTTDYHPFAYATGTPAIGPPTGVTVTGVKEGLRVSWTAAPGANYYNVAITAGSEASVANTGHLVGEFTSETSSTALSSGWFFKTVNGTSTTFTGLEEGPTYRVRIRSEVSLTTTASDWVFDTGKPLFSLSAPTSYSVTELPEALELHFTLVAGILHYQVGFTTATEAMAADDANAENKPGTWYDYDIIVVAEQEEFSRIYEDLANGTEYRLRIRSSDGVNKRSAWVHLTGTPRPNPVFTLSSSVNPILEGNSTTITLTAADNWSGEAFLTINTTNVTAEGSDYDYGRYGFIIS